MNKRFFNICFCLLILTMVFIGCESLSHQEDSTKIEAKTETATDNSTDEIGTKETMTNNNAAETTIQTEIEIESSTEKLNISYRECIHHDRQWDTSEALDTQGSETDMNTAISIACEEIKKIQQTGMLPDYILRGVVFDTEDEVWIIWFSEPPIASDGSFIIGASYNIAIAKRNGKILNMWPAE